MSQENNNNNNNKNDNKLDGEWKICAWCHVDLTDAEMYFASDLDHHGEVNFEGAKVCYQCYQRNELLIRLQMLEERVTKLEDEVREK